MIVKSKIGMGESLSLVSAVSYALSNVVQAWTMAEAPYTWELPLNLYLSG